MATLTFCWRFCWRQADGEMKKGRLSLVVIAHLYDATVF